MLVARRRIPTRTRQLGGFHLRFQPRPLFLQKKKKKTAFLPSPTKTSPETRNMADCGCAPKCACGAEKRGELSEGGGVFFFEEFSRVGALLSVGLKAQKKTLFLSTSPPLTLNSRLQVLLHRMRREVRLREVRMLQEGRRRRVLLRRRRGMLRGRLLLRPGVSFFSFSPFFLFLSLF